MKCTVIIATIGTLCTVGFALSQSLIYRSALASERPAANVFNKTTEPQAPMPASLSISSPANEQGRSPIALRDGREMATRYTGAETKRELESGSARPLSLATGDIDQDGTPDLVSGYASEERGLVVIRGLVWSLVSLGRARSQLKL